MKDKMNIIETIKSKVPLEQYVEELCQDAWRRCGSWKTLQECCFCGGHDCARLSPDGNFYCFQCYATANNSIVFRSLFEKIPYKESIKKFCEELKIKKYDQTDVDWTLLREGACEYMREILYTCHTKYDFRGQQLRPLDYLTEVRKHSIEALLNFRIGFNNGKLIDHLKLFYSEDTIKASGISIIPSGCFVYPYIVEGEIKYFRIKDPNKLKKIQMPIATRSKSAVWYNQDCLKEGKEIFVVEGEDDAVSLWDCGIDAVASCGVLTLQQVNHLKPFNLGCLYSCFDRDATGNRDTEILAKNYENTNLFVVQIPPEKKDIDDLIRESENREDLIHNLKHNAKPPSAEMTSLIRQKEDGYYILKTHEHKLTNWTLTIEAVIFSVMNEDIIRKVKIKSGEYEKEIYIPSEALANVNSLRKFLYSKCDKILLFQGMDSDLSVLMGYWGMVFSPKTILETDHIGEIKQGFIAANIFISNDNELKPLTNGFLSVNDNLGIRIIDIVQRGGGSAGLPIFPLTEPFGGIDQFKDTVFNLMVKNRNLKIALGIGWIKACLWSKQFFSEKQFFPILNLHGKFQGGKSKLSAWLVSFVGLRSCIPIKLSNKSAWEVGSGRQFSYYSSLPVVVEDYRVNKYSEQFHDFFRSIFDRTSTPKGIKADFGIRQVPIRACLLLNGENIPNDPALQSRMVSIEISLAERNPKYFNDIVKLEPQFACIGFDWVKNRNRDYALFMENYANLEALLKKKIDKPREMEVLSVALAGALTEPYFEKRKEEFIDFALKISKEEMSERKKDEIIGNFWEAIDIANKKKKLDEQVLFYAWEEKELYLHIPGLLAEIKGNPFTRHYDIPSHREFTKLFKQEHYVKDFRTVRIENKPGGRWILDIDQCPEIAKNMCSVETEEPENDEL